MQTEKLTPTEQAQFMKCTFSDLIKRVAKSILRHCFLFWADDPSRDQLSSQIFSLKYILRPRHWLYSHVTLGWIKLGEPAGAPRLVQQGVDVRQRLHERLR